MAFCPSRRPSLTGEFWLALRAFETESLARRHAGCVFHLPPQEAAINLVLFGSYPGAVNFQKSPDRWCAYVSAATIEPAMGRDVLAQGAVRGPAVLRQVFAIAVGSTAQIASLQKL